MQLLTLYKNIRASPSLSTLDTDVHICMEGPDGEHNLRLSTKKASSDTIASASFNKLVERLTTSSSEHGEQGR